MILSYFMAAVLSVIIDDRKKGYATNCIENLIKIDEAKLQYESENTVETSTILRLDQLVGKDKIIKSLPKCECGGQYNVNYFGSDPTCSYGNGHFIKKDNF